MVRRLNMDVLDIEENLFATGDAKLHGEMFTVFAGSVCKVLEIFPHIEAARPRSKSGIQSLCSLHISLDKAKGLLQHCSDCSKFYLAITGDSILVKFEKAKSDLQESLRRVDDIVPESIGFQIMEIVAKLDEAVFVLDESEKQAGEELVSLLQKDRKFKTGSNENEELEIFHHAALKLGITSSRAALTERRALKKLLERARAEEDRRKESIVSYLYYLMRKYSKLFRSELGDDIDSQGSTPCSPTILSLENVSPNDVNRNAFDRQLSKSQSFNLKQNRRKSGSMPIPPEEFRCPISLQLMYDPVIIASGQTYERVCIEKWFNDGHSTCPKTQQQLSHLTLTPNYCVKGLITSWCEQNAVPIPDGRPDSLDVNYWRLARSQREAVDSASLGCINSCKQMHTKIVPVEESDATALEEKGVVVVKETTVTEDLVENKDELLDNCSYQDNRVDNLERYQSLLSLLQEGNNVQKRFTAVQKIRYLLKDNKEARIVMGTNKVVETLIQFLRSALNDGDENAQEVGAMALFNLAVNNNRNKQMLIDVGLLPLLDEMITNTRTYESATALYLNLSCLEEAKPIIGSSKAVHFLVDLLQANNSTSKTCKHDALYTLYNLSSYPPNVPLLLSTGIINNLHALLAIPSGPEGNSWVDKVIAVLINMASSREGREEITSTPGLVAAISGILDFGHAAEQEQAVSCLLVLCSADERCCQMVLQEGVIPSLVSVSVNGSARGREKAHKLLKLFREQRQRESSPLRQQPQQQQQQQQQHHHHKSSVNIVNHRANVEPNTICKSRSKRIGRALTSIWKNKGFLVNHS